MGMRGKSNSSFRRRAATVAMGSFHARPKSPEVVTRAAKVMKALRSRTCGRLYSKNTLLGRLAQDLEDLARARGPLIQEQDAVVRQGHLPRRGELAAADQADIGDGVVGGRKGRVATTRWTGWSPARPPGALPAGGWRGAAPASTCPPRAAPAGDYEHNACWTFSVTSSVG
jgi:hypothetical protein